MQSWPYPTLISHRCGGAHTPENTAPGVLWAAQLQAQYAIDLGIEFDVKLSLDNHTLLMHDDTLARTTNGTGTIASQTWAALSTLDAGIRHHAMYANTPIPLLADILALSVQHRLTPNIEIKPCPTREAETSAVIMAELAQMWPSDRLLPLISSFSIEALRAAQQRAPHHPRAWLAHEWPDHPLVTLNALGCVSFHCNHVLLNAARVADIRAHGYYMAAYTVDDPLRAMELLSWGVNSIVTDQIGTMLNHAGLLDICRNKK